MSEWDFTGDADLQGSDAWLSARSKRLGGSEIASVLGISPYKTRLQLWEEKVGIKPSRSISHLPHVKRGIDAEPIARQRIEAKFGIKYTTPVMKGPHQWMVASLDGYHHTHILEIKTMSLEKHKAVLWDEVPEYYECQLEWAMMITDRPRALFVSYRPEDKSIYWTWRRADRDAQEKMFNEALRFWKHVQDKTRPESYELELDL